MPRWCGSSGDKPTLDPAIASTIEMAKIITFNTTISQYLEEINNLVGEPEGRIMVVESTTFETKKQVAVLSQLIEIIFFL